MFQTRKLNNFSKIRSFPTSKYLSTKGQLLYVLTSHCSAVFWAIMCLFREIFISNWEFPKIFNKNIPYSFLKNFPWKLFTTVFPKISLSHGKLGLFNEYCTRRSHLYASCLFYLMVHFIGFQIKFYEVFCKCGVYFFFIGIYFYRF